VLASAVSPGSPAEAAGGSDQASAATVVCVSKVGERNACEADTRSGVSLEKSLGPGACELGRTWGYDEKGVWVSEGCSGEFSVGGKAAEHFGKYTPGGGFRVADTSQGTLNVRVFTYVRYLNQTRLDDTYTDAFGQTKDVQQRQDFQVNKAQIYFFGWIMNPRLRYLTYVWTTNVSQGLGSQVVVAGNLTYKSSDHLTVGGGISALPGVRSTSGNFPYWLSVDARQIGDEFFRPSYTTGIWAEGRIVEGLDYRVMLGNNLSQLGIDAGQLDEGLNTVSAALAWMPTTGEFGPTSGFGDFEHHDDAATRIGLHYTQSDENRQGQPTTDGFENVQIRVSDGSVIFSPDLFGPGIQIDDATYHMASLDAGVKYRGYSFEGEYYRRWINTFRGTGTAGLPFDELNDHGFQLQASTMLQPKTVQLYAGGSKVYGEYGDPWDFRAGLNWFPWQNHVVRWNLEYIQLNRSPVGALSLPYLVGSDGSVVHANFMVWF
jgi:hypothetical protein